MWEHFLPPDPSHRTEAVAGLARALADAPHDQPLHGVMADAMSDAGAEAEGVAHRIVAEPHKARELMARSPDLQATGVHLGQLARKITMRAAGATGQTSTPLERRTVFQRGQRASAVAINAGLAHDAAADGGRAASAEIRHSNVATGHESLANQHEARSYPRDVDDNDTPPEVYAAHEFAGRLHRLGQDVHHAASEVQRELDTRSWRSANEESLRRWQQDREL